MMGFGKSQYFYAICITYENKTKQTETFKNKTKHYIHAMLEKNNSEKEAKLWEKLCIVDAFHDLENNRIYTTNGLKNLFKNLLTHFHDVEHDICKITLKPITIVIGGDDYLGE